MATVCSDRERFLQLGDIFRELQFISPGRRVDRRMADRIISLVSEGYSPSEIRSEIMAFSSDKVF